MKKKLTTKQVKEKLKNIKKKDIHFHKDFDKGMRLSVCNNCGYTIYFAGLWDYNCDLCGRKTQVYSMKKFQDFIFKLQKIATKNYERGVRKR